MKNAKRTLALLLTLCMVIPMCLVSVVSAETATPKTEHYNFYYGVYENLSGANQAHKTSGFPSGWYNDFINGTVNALAIATSSGQKMYHGSIKVNDKNNYKGLILYGGSAKNYVALLLRNPGEVGEYNLQLSATTGSNSTNTNVYVIPVSEIDSWTDACITNGSSTNLRYATTAQTAIGSVISDDTYLIGTINLNTTGNSETLNFDLAKTVQVDNLSDQYVVVIQIADSNGTYACVQGMTWTEKVDEYDITVDESCKDKVSVSHVKAPAGTTVTVSVNAGVGYELTGLTVSGVDAADITDNGDGTYSYDQPGSDVTISATFGRVAVSKVYDFKNGVTVSSLDCTKSQSLYNLYKTTDDVNVIFAGSYNKVSTDDNRPWFYNGGTPFTGATFNGIYHKGKINLSNPAAPVYDFLAVMIKNPGAAGVYDLSLTYMSYRQNTKACEVYMIPASRVTVDGTTINNINFGGLDNQATRTNGKTTTGIAAAINSEYYVGTVNMNQGQDFDGESYTVPVGEVDIAQGEEYIVVFRPVATSGGVSVENADEYSASANSAFALVSGMSLSKDLDKEDTGAVKYFTDNGAVKYFDSAADAQAYIDGLENAQIKLLANIGDDNWELTVKSGVVIDLNGYNLRAGVLDVNGALIDTSAGTTGKVFGVNEASFVSAGQNGCYLPLKNEDGSYGLYKVTGSAFGTKKSLDNKDAQFWFSLEFENAYAYELLKNSENALTVSFKIYLVGGATNDEGEIVDKRLFSEDNITLRNDTFNTYIFNECNSHDPSQTDVYGKQAGFYLTIKNTQLAVDADGNYLPIRVDVDYEGALGTEIKSSDRTYTYAVPAAAE